MLFKEEGFSTILLICRKELGRTQIQNNTLPNSIKIVTSICHTLYIIKCERLTIQLLHYTSKHTSTYVQDVYGVRTQTLSNCLYYLHYI